MKFSILAVVSALICAVYSQTIQEDVDQIPKCSLTCLTNAIVSAGCSLTDYACQCGSLRPTIAQQATPCVIRACNTTEAFLTQRIGLNICSIQAAAASSSGASLATTSPGAATTPAVSSIGSVVGGGATGGATTTASTPSPTVQATSTSSSPTTVSKAAGTRLEAAGAMAGAVILAALAL